MEEWKEKEVEIENSKKQVKDDGCQRSGGPQAPSMINSRKPNGNGNFFGGGNKIQLDYNTVENEEIQFQSQVDKG